MTSAPSIWSRIVSAQEFGLVVVIALMMAGLTLFTKQIDRTDRTMLPEGAAVAPAAPGTFTVTVNARTTTYAEADGWSFRPSGERFLLVRQYKANRFLNRDNLIVAATAASFIAIMAVGMTGIIVMGGIDLSIGAIYALSAVLGAIALESLGGGDSPVPGIVAIPVGVLVCCAVGASCGLVNGIATVGLRVHPFIITLGGMAIFRGVAFVITGGKSISDFPTSYTSNGFRAQFLGVSPIPMLIMIAVAIAGAFVFSRTVFGRRAYAIGGNETAARYAGIPVGRTKILIFTIAGALAGLSAAILLGYYGSAASSAGEAYELKVIAAAVVGGASLSGGRGSAFGAMLGAIVIQLIDNGIIVLGVNSNYTSIVIGLAIVLAVVVDQAKQRLTSRVR